MEHLRIPSLPMRARAQATVRVWKIRPEAPCSFADWDPKRLRASGRDGEKVMTESPSALTMLLSRHTRRREFVVGLGSAAAWPPGSRGAAAGAADSCVPYSITSSARKRIDSGMVNPIAFAVFRLMISSNLVGAWTGRSPGFSPRRMRSTYEAACRYWSAKSFP
jgi:hypothetical protein